MSGTTERSSARSRSVTLLDTGIAGLDEILAGGLPTGRTYLIDGAPGTGKTTLALEFLLAGKARGEAGLYVTLSESEEELDQNTLANLEEEFRKLRAWTAAAPGAIESRDPQ